MHLFILHLQLLAAASMSLTSIYKRPDLPLVHFPLADLSFFCYEIFPRILGTDDGLAAFNGRVNDEGGHSWHFWLPFEHGSHSASVDLLLADRMMQAILSAADAHLQSQQATLEQLQVMLAVGLGDSIARNWERVAVDQQKVLVMDALHHGYDYFLRFPMAKPHSMEVDVTPNVMVRSASDPEFPEDDQQMSEVAGRLSVVRFRGRSASTDRNHSRNRVRGEEGEKLIIRFLRNLEKSLREEMLAHAFPLELNLFGEIVKGFKFEKEKLKLALRRRADDLYRQAKGEEPAKLKAAYEDFKRKIGPTN